MLVESDPHDGSSTRHRVPVLQLDQGGRRDDGFDQIHGLTLISLETRVERLRGGRIEPIADDEN